MFQTTKGRESKLFIRENSEYDIGELFREGKNLKEKTRVNALFLSVVAQFNGEISREILSWYTSLNKISGIQDTEYNQYTIDKLNDKDFLKMAETFAKVADLGINGIHLQENEKKIDLPEKLKTNQFRQFVKTFNENKKLVLLHNRYNQNSEIEKIPFDIKNESQLNSRPKTIIY